MTVNRVVSKNKRQPQRVINAMSARWFKRVAIICLCGGLLVGAYHTLDIYLLPVESLYVTGNISHLDQADLARTVKRQIDAGFFAVDVDRVKVAVQDLAWVQSVSVRRVWPDSLHIEITEHIPVARWQDDYLINERGELFMASSINAQPAAESSLPHITGPDDLQPELYKHFLQIRSVMQGSELDVAKVAVDTRRSMRLTLRNGIVLLMGRMSELPYDYERLTKFVSAYDKSLQQRVGDISEIDLRYTNGFAVQWKKQTAQLRDVAGLQQSRSHI